VHPRDLHRGRTFSGRPNNKTLLLLPPPPLSASSAAAAAAAAAAAGAGAAGAGAGSIHMSCSTSFQSSTRSNKCRTIVFCPTPIDQARRLHSTPSGPSAKACRRASIHELEWNRLDDRAFFYSNTSVVCGDQNAGSCALFPVAELAAAGRSRRPGCRDRQIRRTLTACAATTPCRTSTDAEQAVWPPQRKSQRVF
jgi:hypothetical protein